MESKSELMNKYLDKSFVDYIKSLSYLEYYEFLINNYKPYFKKIYDYLNENNKIILDESQVEEDNKKELEFLINFNRFNLSLKAYDVLEPNYEQIIKDATAEVYKESENREDFNQKQLEIIKESNIKTILSYFTSIYRSTEELDNIYLDKYDCTLYYYCLDRLDELVHKNIRRIEEKNKAN
jgi:hypothetical protein